MNVDQNEDEIVIERALIQFKNEKGEDIGNQFELPLNINRKKLQILYNAIFNKEDPEPTPYLFYLNEFEIKDNLNDVIETNFKEFNSEKVLQITCLPQACYRVESVTRCSSSIAGHSEAILSVAFNNDGTKLASGSGDTTVRFWDVLTQTAHFTCKAHRNWVLVISWSPDGKKLASACKNGEICIWDPDTGKQIGRTLRGHSKWINSLAWEPFHRNPECRRLASASKDFSIRIWDTIIGNTLFTLNSHTMSVTCIKWAGTGLIYSSSQDRTVKIWNDNDGTLKQTLTGHAHWVNTLALSTDYALRLGSFNPEKKSSEENLNIAQQNALKTYENARGECERLVSGSDDFTLHLWTPEISNKPLARLTGHLQAVNDVKFSPDARLLASASFDKSIKLWDGKTGKFITTLRGHVSKVYQLAWSSDSRLLVSGSADSTLKVWNIKNQKLWNDLPGHLDEVYAVDWSPNGECVSSGGKDKLMKIWRK